MSERARTLRELREAGGLTAGQLASRLLTTPERVAAWERGAEVPNHLQSRALARALGVKTGVVLAALGEADEG